MNTVILFLVVFWLWRLVRWGIRKARRSRTSDWQSKQQVASTQATLPEDESHLYDIREIPSQIVERIPYPAQEAGDLFDPNASGRWFAQTTGAGSEVLRTYLGENVRDFAFDAPGFAERFPVGTASYQVLQRVALINSEGVIAHFVTEEMKQRSLTLRFLHGEEWPLEAGVPEVRASKHLLEIAVQHIRNVELRTGLTGLVLLLAETCQQVGAGLKQAKKLAEFEQGVQEHPFDPQARGAYFAETNSQRTYLVEAYDEVSNLDKLVSVLPMGYTGLTIWERRFLLDRQGVIASWGSDKSAKEDSYDVYAGKFALIASEGWPVAAVADRTYFDTVEEAMEYGRDFVRRAEQVFGVSGLQLLGVRLMEAHDWH